MIDNNEIKIIDQWLSKTSEQHIVVIIGAGFSKNAFNKDTNESAGNAIPLWNDIIIKLAQSINSNVDNNIDNLFLVDIYKDSFPNKYEKNVKDMFPDGDIVPGTAHFELKKIPLIEYIITTNNIDTLLDKVYPLSKAIVFDEDIADYDYDQLGIIYLHGHRNYPETWVFSRSDYEDINKKYPVKTSLIRSLIVQYPSLFIGFGHSDPDLHSIMRYVHMAVDKYKPSALSLSINEHNDALKNHWNKLGLSIACVDSLGNDTEEAIINAIKYISEKRLQALSKSNILIPGNRLRNSHMENIKETLHDCKSQNGKEYLCDYHQSRRDTEILRLQDVSSIIRTSPFTSQLEVNSEVFITAKNMKNGFTPTGSWGLMPSHRKWLEKAFFDYLAIQKQDILEIMILGIAGLPHFIDICTLVMNILKDSNIKSKFLIVDKCDGPLNAINSFIKKNFIPKSKNKHLYEEVIANLKGNNFTIETKKLDILKINFSEANFADICLSHHLVSFWGITSSKIYKYAANVAKFLKPDGILISAQNICTSDKIDNDTRDILKFNQIMASKNLLLQNSDLIFDLYDFESNAFGLESDKSIQIRNETLLTIHNNKRQ